MKQRRKQPSHAFSQPCDGSLEDFSGGDFSGEPSGEPSGGSSQAFGEQKAWEEKEGFSKEALISALEAMVFVSERPLTLSNARGIFTKVWAEKSAPERQALLRELGPAWQGLQDRWQHASAQGRGFVLAEVAGGLTFRSHVLYADVLRAMRTDRPQRLSRAMLETLAIVAYRQPVTKPDMDAIRGVDCSGSLRALLERNMLCIVGKKQHEPGHPLLYGTSDRFLELFHLKNLKALPSLRDIQELSETSDPWAGQPMPSLEELTQAAPSFAFSSPCESEIETLQQALHALNVAESSLQKPPETQPEACNPH